jgi:transposase
MEFDPTFLSRTAARFTRRTTACAVACVRGRHLVDASQRRAVERSALAFSFRLDLLATPQGVDRKRSVGKGVGPFGAKVGSPRPDRPRRKLCRWHVCLGKKGGEKVGKTKRGKGTKIMVYADGNGLPLGIDTTSASPHEVTLIESLLEQRVLRRKPQRLIYDTAADSDPLRQRLQRRGIELICPHRGNRRKPPTQDGRKLRRYGRRWKIERSISWLQNFRRLVTRYEHYAHLFHGFVQLACLIVTLNRF